MSRLRPFRRIGVVRGVLKLPIVAAVALTLAVGLAACGGGGGSDSTTTEASAPQEASNGSAKAGATGAKKEKSGSAKGNAKKKSGSGGESESSSEEASKFVPKQHHDAGGGSKQVRVKGGDNSVQEFGKEAGSSELDAAATVLHNFLDARAESNWAAACEYMSKSVIEGFEKLATQAKQVKDSSCAGILEALTNPSAKQLMKKEAAKANVRSLRVEGDRSFVIYTGLEGTIMAMPMAHEGGQWKVSGLAGTPLN